MRILRPARRASPGRSAVHVAGRRLAQGRIAQHDRAFGLRNCSSGSAAPSVAVLRLGMLSADGNGAAAFSKPYGNGGEARKHKHPHGPSSTVMRRYPVVSRERIGGSSGHKQSAATRRMGELAAISTMALHFGHSDI